jgi:protein-tyrosine phosphatase
MMRGRSVRGPGDRVRVVVVCLGNICRSPTAEGVFLQLLQDEAPGLRVQVDSAGTAAYHVGEAPDGRSIAAARRRGIDLSVLRARSLRREDFRDFDLILAMDQDNLRVAKARRPANARAAVKLFLEYAPQCGMREVPDPYFGDADGFERVLDLTAAASRGLLAELRDQAAYRNVRSSQ